MDGAKLTQEERDAIDAFLEAKNLPLNTSVTFEDVTLSDDYSEVRSRQELHDFSTTLIPDVLELNIPFIGANMESITNAEFIIALEREGGLGIPPQTIPLEKRCEMLERVKRASCALIEEPLTARSDMALGEAKELMRRYNVNGLVIVDEDKKPTGILSSRDWFYEENGSVKVSDLMTHKPTEIVTAPENISFKEARQILKTNKIEKLPLVDDTGRLAGLITARGLFFEHHYPRAFRNNRGQFIRVGSVGVGERFDSRTLNEVEAQLKYGITALAIETARANSINTKDVVTEIRKAFPKLPLIVGNVATPEATKMLCELGTKVVKVGQGSGDACTTRKTGIGIPQLTAVAQCSVIAKRYGSTVISDGGIRYPGDVAKAIIGGASAVMIGSLFAGTEESAAIAHRYNSKEFGREILVKDYLGAASYEEQLKRVQRGDLDRIRRPEGGKRIIPVIGPLKRQLDELLDGLRSTMSYRGVRNFDELAERGRFTRQTRSGFEEGIKR